jgi:hypothetical protein
LSRLQQRSTTLRRARSGGALRGFEDLRDEHTGWVQRLHATLFHQGAPAAEGDLLSALARRRLEAGTGSRSTSARRSALTCP